MNRYIIKPSHHKKWNELAQLNQQMSHLVDDFWVMSSSNELLTLPWSPTFEVDDSDDYFMIVSKMPEIPQEQVKIDLDENKLTVTLECENHKLKQDHMNRVFERTSQSFYLPPNTDLQTIHAEFHHHTLVIKARKIHHKRSIPFH